jgi:hypothetical protein
MKLALLTAVMALATLTASAGSDSDMNRYLRGYVEAMIHNQVPPDGQDLNLHRYIISKYQLEKPESFGSVTKIRVAFVAIAEQFYDEKKHLWRELKFSRPKMISDSFDLSRKDGKIQIDKISIPDLFLLR